MDFEIRDEIYDDMMLEEGDLFLVLNKGSGGVIFHNRVEKKLCREPN